MQLRVSLILLVCVCSFGRFESTAEAVVILTNHRDAWIASLPSGVTVTIDDDLEDEAANVGVIQTLTLNGSGIRLDVTTGSSDHIDDFGITTNSSFETLTDDGTSSPSLPGLTELDLVLDNAANDPNVITVTLPNPVQGISFDFDQVNASNDLVFFSPGNSAVQTAVRSQSIGGNEAGFFGFVDTTSSFSTFTLTHSSVLAGSNTQDAFEIGRISAAAAAVPEPSSFALLALAGLGYCGVALRRRRRAADSQAA